MLAAVPEVRSPDGSAKAFDGTTSLSAQAFRSGGLERWLGPGEVLVRTGDRKTHLYRVESGLVCAYWQSPTGERRAVGFSFVGDVVGLGGLDRHVTTVEAAAETVVQCLPRADLDHVLAQDLGLAQRHADATDAELALLKADLVAQGRAQTLGRVAALLTVLANTNVHEGRSADIVGDDITCGFVADHLGLGVGVLEEALTSLARQGLIEAMPDGALRLRDREALERLAITPV